MQNTQGNTLQHYIDVVDNTLGDALSCFYKSRIALICFNNIRTTSECIDICKEKLNKQLDYLMKSEDYAECYRIKKLIDKVK